MSRAWLPISTFPDDYNGKRVFDFWLTWAPDCAPLNPKPPPEREARFRGQYRCWSSIYTASHWMPLPPPPEEK